MDKSPEIYDFVVQCSFDLEILRLRKVTKNAGILTYTCVFYVLLVKKIKSKPPLRMLSL